MGDNESIVGVCFHCGNKTLLNAVATHVERGQEEIGMDDFGDPQFTIEFRTTWTLLMCPACNNVTLRQEDWCSEDDPWSESPPKILYPNITRTSGNIPKNIHSAFEAARKVRSIDGAICAISLRRTLEMMCKHRGAKGRDLYSKLKSLSDNGVLPPILGDMAQILKILGNAAAHGDDSEFEEDVVSAIVDFTQIILDYVYNIPASLAKVQKKITETGFARGSSTSKVAIDKTS